MATLFDTKTVNVATVIQPTTPPAIPSLVSPLNGATGVSLLANLAWDPASGAGSYRVQVAKDNAFGQIVYDQADITVTSISVSSLEANTQYFWRVNAANPTGTSDWSDAWSFTTGAGGLALEPLTAMLTLTMMMGMVTQMMPKGQGA